jgi:hypothetical protein
VTTPSPAPEVTLDCPQPVPLRGHHDPTELAATFHSYLRDYIGDDERPGPRGPICPFVRRALDVAVLFYAELQVDGDTPPLAVAQAFARYLAWFERALPPGPGEHPALVVAFPGPPEPLLPVVSAAYSGVRAAVYDRGCTSAVFWEDPADVTADHRDDPPFFTAPTPFYVLRRIVVGDLQMSYRVPEMFPAYHRLHADEVRRTRLRDDDARDRWARACAEHGLMP